MKSFGIPPIVKLAASLRFFAEGGYQKGVGREYDVGLSQSAFSATLEEMLDVFEVNLCRLWIKWMSNEEMRSAALKFYEKYKIPSVMGCIDGTHIKIVGPKHNKHSFYNRKGYFSLNALVVCDQKMRFRFIDASHPGACHDSLVWNVSELKRHICNNRSNFWMLGDAGYPLESFLLTPYRTPEEGSVEAKFNLAHSRCRNIIERAIGLLKSRWRCLLGARELYYSPQKAAKIFNVCVMLHNLCIHFKDQFADIVEIPDCDEEESLVTMEEDNIDFGMQRMSEAQRIRNQIAHSLP
ncbi:putative nuclease HARBI1 [Bactrocera neohumeralis]|nr:putative nuclease HARBI1 [Bactrocera neohumeralis]XP_050335024.1 putative nuclease HARBI1 [Bactrocera neohumeralis]XP_050339735.1 putative nuclease HARBI1 [Bactrocera neohumeralis]